MSEETESKINEDHPPFRGMIFEGGGASGVAHVGAIQVFEEHGLLEDIHYFVGSSAGAIIAAALACHADSKYLKKELYKIDFNDFRDHSACYFKNLKGFFKRFGWYRGDTLFEWISRVLGDLTANPKITFGEVYQNYGNYLIVTVTGINNGETLYLDHLNSPEMEVRLAVKRSALIPLFFQADYEKKKIELVCDGKIKTKKVINFYVDGGVLNNYPIRQLDHLLSKNQVVGFKLMSTKELHEIHNPHCKMLNTPDGVIDYVQMLLAILRNQALKLHIEEEDWKRTVRIDVGTISATDFDLSDENKNFLVSQGRLAAEKFLSTT